jgi:PAS domain S-box-containing protein
MKEQLEDPAQEIKRLQRCINDLVSLLALPAIWRGDEPSQIVQTVLDVLLRMLSLHFAYARLNDAFSAMPVEILRVAESSKINLPVQELRNLLGHSFAADTQGSRPQIRNRLGVEDISIFPVPLGVQGEIGLIALGSDQAGFPGKTESLLLSVAVNQASIGLQEARLLSEQKRIANELDRRVAERTAELATANEELRKKIAERKLAEERLSQAHAQVVRSEERWRSVFENSAVGVALTDLSGRFMATNPVYQKMVGYTDDELQQLTFLDITHEENVEHNRSLIRDLLDGKHQQFQIEKQYRRKDGQPVWVRNNVSIVPGTDRMPRFLMALSEDITQRKLSEESLAKARSELARVAGITSLGVLAASIAHEVNQPLSGIITNASTCLRMLSAEPPNIDGARETVRRTIRDGNRASDVITRLRTLYSKKEPSPESMNLNEAAREVTALSLTELQRSGVILRHELADDLPLVVGDRIQLQQVILNLLRNAADAMSTIDDRPRELLIRTERDKANRVRLSVQDSGVGFTPQTADKIFEAFYTTKLDGMGIGLSISRSIIEAHQGHIWATPNDGPGATFFFAIPCAREDWAGAESRNNRTDPSTDTA